MLLRLSLGISLVFLIQSVHTQNPSPCPEIFSYEPRGQEQDRWYGVISLQTKEDLDGVWLKIVLDRPAELLGNWFGEAVSSDNQEFTIKNSRYKLEAGPPVSVRFFIKYNAASTIPSVKSIKLNGKTVCTNSREEVVTTAPQLHISQVRPITNRPSNRPAVRPTGGGEGAYLNNREETRPTGTGLGGSSGESSSNNNYNSNNVGGSSQETGSSSHNYNGGSSREKGTSSSSSNNYNKGGSSHERGTSGSSYNNQHSNSDDYQSGTRRPSSSSQSTSHNNQRNRESTTRSGTKLSVDEDTSRNTNNGFDFFPGDFAYHGQPTPSRAPSRPSNVNKRNVQCGTVAMKPSPLISYGQNTTQGQWPWHAALYYAQGAQLMYTCGATLISEYHIVTAAHCVAKPQTNRPIDTKKLAVYLGKYSLKKFGSGTQDREVSEIFIHPQYNYSVYFNDIAVLKLKNPIDITNYVRPCCLWEDGTDIEYVLNKLGTVVGWGFDENRQISDTLMQAQMPVVSTVNCIYSNREFFSQFTFEKTYCAGFRNGTTVCNGDSGGGMVFPRSGTSGHNTVWQIRGIVSVGVALQGQGVCDPSHYIVFTDVAKHIDWIRQVMKE